MNLYTAKAMLELLQRSSPSHSQDDSYYIIERLLNTEIRKGEAQYVCAGSHQDGPPIDFDQPTPEEIQAWDDGEKVKAIKMYRERTRHGLYDSKKALEENETHRMLRRHSQRQEHTEITRITSCA